MGAKSEGLGDFSPPAGSRGRSPGRGSGGRSPPEAASIVPQMLNTFCNKLTTAREFHAYLRVISLI